MKTGSDSGRCTRNSTQMSGEKPKEIRNNDKCWVASQDCTTWNSTHTQKGSRVWL